jgi:hypothetical protein
MFLYSCDNTMTVVILRFEKDVWAADVLSLPVNGGKYTSRLTDFDSDRRSVHLPAHLIVA